MNLVAGATGLLGGEICRLLAERGAPLRLVRPSCDLEEGMKTSYWYRWSLLQSQGSTNIVDLVQGTSWH
jgi:hypothetical protein